MSLTAEQRRNLPASDFAVPGKRALPIHDENHVRMAWSQASKTKGLTSEELAEARRRILRKARSMGLDTSEWTKMAAVDAGFEATEVDEELPDLEAVKRPIEPTGMRLQASMRFEAATLSLESDESHPNKMPFSGILTRIGEPSDGAPNGSNGRRIILSAEAAEAATGSLLGMGVNLTSDLAGHNPQNKVGIITAANVEGNAIVINGFIYKSDFPDVARTIKAQRDQLGFSFEADHINVADISADPLKITDLKFTGASILLKAKAAYRTTSLAASAAQPQDIEMTKEEMAALLADTVKPIAEQTKALVERLDKIEAAQTKAVTSIEASAARVREMVEPHAAALEAAADKMESAGIGLHPNSGHVALARAMAGSMRRDAADGKTPYFHGGMYASAATNVEDKRKADEDARAAAEKVAADTKLAIQAAVEAATKPLHDKLAAAETKIADVKATAFKASESPVRRTLAPQVLTLLKKAGEAELGENDKIPLQRFNEILTKGGITNPEQRMAIKAAAATIIDS